MYDTEQYDESLMVPYRTS